MSIDGGLSIAIGGLANVNRQLAVVSQNVANASTPGYSAEVSTQQSITAEGVGLGVRSGPAIRTIDTALQAEVFSQNASVAGLQTRQNALQAIDAVQGTPGQGGDIASLLGDLQNQFSTLLNDPSNQVQQSQVVSAATNVAQGINALSAAYTSQRQTAQDSIVAGVATLNATLSTIGDLSNKIVTLKAGGQSTADLENQRDSAVASLSQLLDVKALEQPSGDLLIITQSGLTLPIRGAANPFSVGDANMDPTSGAPAIMLQGADVTARMQGGQIGANVTLRDTTMPTDQAYLDVRNMLLDGLRGQTPFTPATGIFLQLEARLSTLTKASLEIACGHARTMAGHFRKHISSLPLQFYSRNMPNAMTALKVVGSNMSAQAIVNSLDREHGLLVSANGGKLSDTVFRVSHMGNLELSDFDRLVSALTQIFRSTSNRPLI